MTRESPPRAGDGVAGASGRAAVVVSPSGVDGDSGGAGARTSATGAAGSRTSVRSAPVPDGAPVTTGATVVGCVGG